MPWPSHGHYNLEVDHKHRGGFNLNVISVESMWEIACHGPRLGGTCECDTSAMSPFDVYSTRDLMVSAEISQSRLGGTYECDASAMSPFDVYSTRGLIVSTQIPQRPSRSDR